jgi:raffinose/stachyose/melibiose transport system substrate-binding protein
MEVEQMKRLVSLTVAVLVLAAAFLVLGCAPKQQAKMTVWINGADSYIGPTEKELPQEQWYISQAFKRFEKANPGVTLELVMQGDQAAAHESFKAAGAAGNAPDVANLWTGQPIFAMKEIILPLDSYVPKDDLEKIVGWESVRDGFKPDGTILGYPASQNQICFFLYNKAVVKAAGLDFEAAPPRTLAEFDAACEAIKATGVTPILVNEANEGVPWFMCWIGDYWWTQATTNAGIIEETYGRAKFADDKGWLDALAYYRSLYVKGYLRKDLLTANDSFQLFLQGKGAMWPAVTSFLADAEKSLGADCGVLMPPEMIEGAALQNSCIGGPGQGLVVAKNSKAPKVAAKLLSFLNSKAEVLASQKIHSYPILRTDITLQELGWTEGSNIAKIYPYSKTYNYWVDNLHTSGPAAVFYSRTGLVAVGKLTPLELAQEMDAAVGQ